MPDTEEGETPDGDEPDRETPVEPAPPPAAAPPPSGEPPEEDWSTRFRYLLAEFDNYRKRIERDQATFRRDARALVLRELLPLYDALEGAEETARRLPEGDPIRRGMELLFREWERFLSAEKVQRVAREGQPFRADDEEAVGELPADPAHPEGSVAQVVQQGFRSPAGLLRPAKVLIARARAPPTDTSKPTADVVDAAHVGDEE